MSFDASPPTVRFALEAVRRAALLSTRIQTRMVMKKLTKSDLSPVTVADFAAQAVVAKALADAFPDDVLVGEEDSEELANEEGRDVLEMVTDFVGNVEPGASPEDVCEWIDRGKGKPEDRFWTLDPIDGTKGYLRGGQFAVALALIEGGEVKLGVLGCPNLGEACSLESTDEFGVMTVAVRGQGAWWTGLSEGAAFSELHVSDCEEVAEARLLRSFESDHTNVDQMGEVAGYLGLKTEPLMLDSQAKYALLASGNGEMLFRLLSPSRPGYEEMIWDQAAGSIVVEEAGGCVTDLAGNSLDFSQGRTLAKNRGVCATNGRLHGVALHALSRLD